MLRTLYAKLAAVLTLLLLVLGVIYGAFSLYTTELFLQELNQRFNRDLARELLVRQNLLGGEDLDEQSIKQLFSYYMHINPAIELYLLDTEGNILAYEAPEKKIKRERVDVGPIRAFLEGDRGYPIRGDDPRSETRTKVFSAAAYPVGGPPRQYLYVVLTGEDYDSVVELVRDSYFAEMSLTGVVAIITFGVLAGLFAFYLLTQRLVHLTGVMERFRASGFREHHPYTALHRTRNGDEIDTLGETFDVMAAHIIDQMHALEERDALRRNLVANVSHDLRTPLSALQGYLETLQMKQERLDDRERARYIDTAFRQGERLTHLVEELFELSRLDASEAPPEDEPISLGELVQDTVQKFALRARDQGIELRVRVARGLPMVRGDLRMLTKVLENLIQNALAHTPADGAIELLAQADAGSVRLEISNDGAGIAASDLPHVFDRFYQSPDNRHGRGGGLGLAIVKRIVELHGGVIGVESTDGHTRFRVSLPAAD